MNDRISNIENSLATITDILTNITDSMNMSKEDIVKLNSEVAELNKQPSTSPLFEVAPTSIKDENSRFLNIDLLKKK